MSSSWPAILRGPGSCCRRKARVGRLWPGDSRTVGKRMRGGDDSAIQKRFQLRRRTAVDQTLKSVSVPPVLLSLTADARLPPPSFALGLQAHANQRYRSPEPAPVRAGPKRMHCPAFHAAPTLHPERLMRFVEVPCDVTVAPKPKTAAPWASRRTGPGVVFPQAHQGSDIYRQREYQVVYT